jgi:membrane associated rhomboid family serine protease
MTRMQLALVVAPNVLVYLAWQGADFFKSNRLQRFLTANFLLSEAHVQAGKWWTLLTYSFSHMNVLHLGINMFCLVSIGRGVMGCVRHSCQLACRPSSLAASFGRLTPPSRASIVLHVVG